MRRALALAAACSLLLPEAAVSGALFADATAGAGIPAIRFGEGVNAVDLDGDGLPELFLPAVRGRDRVFRNLGGLRFADATDAWGIAGGGGIGAVAADLDRDGIPEVAVVRGAWPAGGVSLLTRGGTGPFADVGAAAGVSTRRNGIAAAVADVDADGRPDLFVSAWGGDLLFRAAGGPGLAFAEDAAAAGLAASPGRSWGALFTDLTGDRLPDLVVTRGSRGSAEASRLYVNAGGGRFEDRTGGTDLPAGGWSMGVVALDCDDDGDQDLFLTGYEGPDRLYRNDGGGVLRDITRESGIASARGVGAAAGQVDGDLAADLVVAGFDGPVRLWRGLGGCRFADASVGSGLQAHPRNEGVALADLDGDGDLDCYVTNYDGANRLYRNTLDDPRFLKVVPSPATDGMHGMTARLFRAGSRAPLARQEIASGSGYCSQGPPEFLFRVPDAGPWDVEVVPSRGPATLLRGLGPGRVALP